MHFPSSNLATIIYMRAPVFSSISQQNSEQADRDLFNHFFFKFVICNNLFLFNKHLIFLRPLKCANRSEKLHKGSLNLRCLITNLVTRQCLNNPILVNLNLIFDQNI